MIVNIYIYLSFEIFSVLVYGGVQHILCCDFCFVCLRLVYPMLPTSLDCPSLVAPSVSLTFIYSLLVSKEAIETNTTLSEHF